MKKVLFLCTGNSCRSQMAQGFVNHFYPGEIEAKSAGVKPTTLNPYAVFVMKEIGIDISGHTVNKPEDFKDIDFDYLITLCDHAAEFCPLFFSEKPLKKLHWNFPDPAKFQGTGDEIITEFRNVRDDIKKQITDFWGNPK